MPVLNAGLIDEITARVLEGVARGWMSHPVALTFLLRRYTATRRDDLHEAIESVFDCASAELQRLECAADRADWLTAFAQAAAMSGARPLHHAAVRLASGLRREWRAGATFGDRMRAIGACLEAVHACDLRELVPDAIDELERVVGAAYRPGDGMAHAIAAPRVARGALGDQMAAATTLLTAYALTGRLPYSMLAEELLQVARRLWWDEKAGGFFDGEGGAVSAGGTGLAPRPTKAFAPNCEAAVVLCRLAALHRHPAYRQAAVVATAADYAGDAERTLLAQEATLGERGLDAARFGLALHELLTLR